MRRRLARLGTVVGLSIGIVTVIPALTSSAFAADCSNSFAVSASCVNVPGVATITSAPTEPATTGCVKDDCLTVAKNGTGYHKKPQDAPPSHQATPTPRKPVSSTPQGAVLGIQLQRFDTGASDFYTGSFDKALPLEAEGWRNGIYRNPISKIAEAPPPSMWSGITAPAAFTSFVIGILLLVSAVSFKRLMLN
jgi:hypothetical protein